MAVKHRLKLEFQPSHVQEPLTCEMTKRFRDVVFNVDAISVGIDRASMQLSIIGEPESVKQAKDYLKSLNVDMRTISAHKCKACMPDVPQRTFSHTSDQKIIERKLWLTFLGCQQDQPFLWIISRRFDVTYKIMQSTTGPDLSILSLVVWGIEDEVDAVVTYLREQGIHVEYGAPSVSTPFGPEF